MFSNHKYIRRQRFNSRFNLKILKRYILISLSKPINKKGSKTFTPMQGLWFNQLPFPVQGFLPCQRFRVISVFQYIIKNKYINGKKQQVG